MELVSGFNRNVCARPWQLEDHAKHLVQSALYSTPPRQ